MAALCPICQRPLGFKMVVGWERMENQACGPGCIRLGFERLLIDLQEMSLHAESAAFFMRRTGEALRVSDPALSRAVNEMATRLYTALVPKSRRTPGDNARLEPRDEDPEGNLLEEAPPADRDLAIAESAP